MGVRNGAMTRWARKKDSREDEVDGTLDGIERAKVTDFAIITKGPPT
jgi:hypothetical protein